MHSLSLQILIALAAAGGGAFAARFGVPLGWLLGTAIVTAGCSFAGYRVRFPAMLYRGALVVVGTGVGLSITSGVAEQLGSVLYLVPVAALCSIAIGRLLTPLFGRMSGLDMATAHFSLVPAGIAEMAETSAHYGADVGTVATMHALRVLLIVLILPAALAYVVEPHTSVVAPVTGTWTWSLALAFVIGGFAGKLGSLVRMPNPYMLAPIVVLLLASGSNLIEAHEPRILVVLAQIAVGLNLGSRFDRVTIQKLPRAFAAALPIMLFHAALMVALACGASWLSGVDVPSAILGFATGGTVEMVLTAKTIGADIAFVTIFQAARGVFGNVLAGLIYQRTYKRQYLP